MQDKKKQEVEGVRSPITGNLMTYDHGKILPAEWYDNATLEEETEVDRMTSEELYISVLERGARRDLRWESELDMSQIDPELLKNAKPPLK